MPTQQGDVYHLVGEGNGNPLQYSCLENPMNREAWWATVHGVTKDLDMTEQLSSILLKVHLVILRGSEPTSGC